MDKNISFIKNVLVKNFRVLLESKKPDINKNNSTLISPKRRGLFFDNLNIGLLFLQILSDSFIIFGPSINYFFQIMKFCKTKSSKGFSKLLCFLSLFSHSFRVVFWFGKPYKLTLLFQSFLVIIVLLILVHLCVKYGDKKGSITSYESNVVNTNSELDDSVNTDRDSSITATNIVAVTTSDKNIIKNNTNNSSDEKQISFQTKILNLMKKISDFNLILFDFSKTFKLSLIWRWDKQIEYYKFYFVVMLSIGMLFKTIGYRFQNFIDLLGLISIILENLASIPQIIELYKYKNTKNISNIMIFMWFGGNLYKAMYNIFYKQPVLLILGSFFCTTLNGVLAIQVIVYRRMEKNKKGNVKIANKIGKWNIDQNSQSSSTGTSVKIFN